MYKVHIVGRGVEEISVRVQAKIRETRLREAFKKKMSQKVEKVQRGGRGVGGGGHQHRKLKAPKLKILTF